MQLQLDANYEFKKIFSQVPESTLARFKLANSLALSFEKLKFPGKIDFQDFLTPNLQPGGSTRKILSWLLFQQGTKKLSKLDEMISKAAKKNYSESHLRKNHLNFFKLPEIMNPPRKKFSNLEILELSKRNEKMKRKIAEFEESLDQKTKELESKREILETLRSDPEDLKTVIAQIESNLEQTDRRIAESQALLTQQMSDQEKLNVLENQSNFLRSQRNTIIQKIEKLQSRNLNQEKINTSGPTTLEHFQRIFIAGESLKRQQKELEDLAAQINDAEKEIDTQTKEIQIKFHALKSLLSGKDLSFKILLQ